MKFPVIKAFSATLAYLARHAVDLLKALWLPTLLLIVLQFYALAPMLGALSSIVALGDNPDPAEAVALLGDFAKWGGVLMVGSAIVMPMMTVASLTHLIRGEESRLPFYFRYGGDELRVLAAYVLLTLMVFVIGLVGGLASSVIVLLFRLVGPQASDAAADIADLLVNVVTFWFQLRLCALYPASIATRRIGFDVAWRTTGGQVARLLGFWLLTGLVIGPFAIVIAALIGGDLFPLLAKIVEAGDDQAAARAALIPVLDELKRIYSPDNPSIALFAPALFVTTLASTAIANVAAGTAWRYLTTAAPASADDRQAGDA